MRVKLVGRTDVGLVRKGNEDNFSVTGDIHSGVWQVPTDSVDITLHGLAFIVADGMGGAEAGEIASELAIDTIKSFLQENIQPEQSTKEISGMLQRALVEAHNAITTHVSKNPKTHGMGTTATVCYVKNDTLFIAWIGDSRVYRYSADGRVTTHSYYEGNTEILTNDHSLVWMEVLQGRMTPEEARVAQNSNIITQSLGDIYKVPNPEVKMYPLHKGDIILSCSDGLNGMISDTDIDEILDKNNELNDTCTELLIAAKNGGGSDNITIVLCEVEDGQVYTNSDLSSTIKSLGQEKPQTIGKVIPTTISGEEAPTDKNEHKEKLEIPREVSQFISAESEDDADDSVQDDLDEVRQTKSESEILSEETESSKSQLEQRAQITQVVNDLYKKETGADTPDKKLQLDPIIDVNLEVKDELIKERKVLADIAIAFSVASLIFCGWLGYSYWSENEQAKYANEIVTNDSTTAEAEPNNVILIQENKDDNTESKSNPSETQKKKQSTTKEVKDNVTINDDKNKTAQSEKKAQEPKKPKVSNSNPSREAQIEGEIKPQHKDEEAGVAGRDTVSLFEVPEVQELINSITMLDSMAISKEPLMGVLENSKTSRATEQKKKNLINFLNKQYSELKKKLNE